MAASPAEERRLAALARAGLATRGVVYAAIGLLALRFAVGRGGATLGPRDALRRIDAQPFGRVALIVIAVGLAAFSAWRFVDGAQDVERRGRRLRGLLQRAGLLASGAIHAAWALFAAGLAIGRDAGGGDRSARDWTARLLGEPFGRWLVAIVAVAIACYGAAQLRLAWRGRFLRQIETDGLDRGRLRALRALGAIGLSGFGAVWLLVAACFAGAAWTADAAAAHGIGGALGALLARPYGDALLAAAATGVIAFGLYNLVLARFFAVRRG